MQALIVAETTPKLMKLASFARTVAPDHHWRAISTGAFTVAVDRYDFTNRKARLKLKHKVQLNRIITLAAEADTIYVATDPTPRGDLLAADLTDQLLGRYPDRQVYRLRLHQLTSRDFGRALAASVPINTGYVDAMRVSRVLNFLVSMRAETLTGRPSGRAVLPLLSRLAAAERPDSGRIRVRLTSGVEFTSEFGRTEVVAGALARLRSWGEVPKLQIERDEVELPPPERFSIRTLQQRACQILGAGSIEVASQTGQLYGAGHIGIDHAIDQQYCREAREELVSFGDEPGDDTVIGPAVVPVHLRCLPSDVPKPVRPVYRVIWANTLCSFSQPMRMERESAGFIVDGLRFRSESYVPLSRGFDHASFGLFYRRGRIGHTRAVEATRMYGGGLFEYELLGALSDYDNPAFVIKAAQNLGYIGLDGIEVTVLEHGRHVLDVVNHSIPQLLDPMLFRSTESFLRSDYDARELLEPWICWAESVAKRVKKREVAYLR